MRTSASHLTATHPLQFHDDETVAAIKRNAHRYVDLFSQVIDSLLPEPRAVVTDDDDVADVLAAHRWQQLQAARREAAAQGVAADPKNTLPPQLMRRYASTPARKRAPRLVRWAHVPRVVVARYDVHFRSGAKAKPVALRHVSAPDIGSLVTIKAIVTRVSDVKPLVTVITYTCDDCGMEVYQTVRIPPPHSATAPTLSPRSPTPHLCVSDQRPRVHALAGVPRRVPSQRLGWPPAHADAWLQVREVPGGPRPGAA